MPETNAKPAARCEHIRFDGVRCGSPALRGKLYCYYHARIRYLRPQHVVPVCDTPSAVSYAVQGVVQALLDGQLDRDDAKVAIYGMRLQFQTLLKKWETSPNDMITEDPEELRYQARLQEIGPKDVTGEKTIELLKDRVRFG